VARKITVKVDADDSGYKRGLNRVEKDTRSWSQRMKGSFKNLKAGAGGIIAGLGAALLGLGGTLREAAQDADQAVLLADGLSRVAGASRAATDAVEDYITQVSIATGVADSELRPAMLRLATATGDVTTAQDLLTLALDIAAQTGKPVETVAKALGKAWQGSNGPLEKLTGLSLKAGGNARTWASTQELLNRKFGGAAQKKADTYTGTVDRLGVAFNEAVEALGTELLPLLQEFADYLSTPEGKRDLQAFATGIKDIGSALRDVAGFLADIQDSIPDWLRDLLLQPGGIARILSNPGSIFGQGSGWGGSTGGGSSWERTGARTQVTVYGALDPQGTARTIQRAVAGADVRAGRKRFL
jgi:hypothetical protein